MTPSPDPVLLLRLFFESIVIRSLPTKKNIDFFFQDYGRFFNCEYDFNGQFFKEDHLRQSLGTKYES